MSLENKYRSQLSVKDSSASTLWEPNRTSDEGEVDLRSNLLPAKRKITVAFINDEDNHEVNDRASKGGCKDGDYNVEAFEASEESAALARRSLRRTTPSVRGLQYIAERSSLVHSSIATANRTTGDNSCDSSNGSGTDSGKDISGRSNHSSDMSKPIGNGEQNSIQLGNESDIWDIGISDIVLIMFGVYMGRKAIVTGRPQKDGRIGIRLLSGNGRKGGNLKYVATSLSVIKKERDEDNNTTIEDSRNRTLSEDKESIFEHNLVIKNKLSVTEEHPPSMTERINDKNIPQPCKNVPPLVVNFVKKFPKNIPENIPDGIICHADLFMRGDHVLITTGKYVNKKGIVKGQKNQDGRYSLHLINHKGSKVKAVKALEAALLIVARNDDVDGKYGNKTDSADTKKFDCSDDDVNSDYDHDEPVLPSTPTLTSATTTLTTTIAATVLNNNNKKVRKEMVEEVMEENGKKTDVDMEEEKKKTEIGIKNEKKKEEKSDTIVILNNETYLLDSATSGTTLSCDFESEQSILKKMSSEVQKEKSVDDKGCISISKYPILSSLFLSIPFESDDFKYNTIVLPTIGSPPSSSSSSSSSTLPSSSSSSSIPQNASASHTPYPPQSNQISSTSLPQSIRLTSSSSSLPQSIRLTSSPSSLPQSNRLTSSSSSSSLPQSNGLTSPSLPQSSQLISSSSSLPQSSQLTSSSSSLPQSNGLTSPALPQSSQLMSPSLPQSSQLTSSSSSLPQSNQLTSPSLPQSSQLTSSSSSLLQSNRLKSPSLPQSSQLISSSSSLLQSNRLESPSLPQSSQLISSSSSLPQSNRLKSPSLPQSSQLISSSSSLPQSNRLTSSFLQETATTPSTLYNSSDKPSVFVLAKCNSFDEILPSVIKYGPYVIDGSSDGIISDYDDDNNDDNDDMAVVEEGLEKRRMKDAKNQNGDKEGDDDDSINVHDDDNDDDDNDDNHSHRRKIFSNSMVGKYLRLTVGVYSGQMGRVTSVSANRTRCALTVLIDDDLDLNRRTTIALCNCTELGEDTCTDEEKNLLLIDRKLVERKAEMQSIADQKRLDKIEEKKRLRRLSFDCLKSQREEGALISSNLSSQQIAQQKGKGKEEGVGDDVMIVSTDLNQKSIQAMSSTYSIHSCFIIWLIVHVSHHLFSILFWHLSSHY